MIPWIYRGHLARLPSTDNRLFFFFQHYFHPIALQRAVGTAVIFFTCAARGCWFLAQSWSVPQGQSPGSFPQQEPEDFVGKLWMNKGFMVQLRVSNCETATGGVLHKDHVHLSVWNSWWGKRISEDMIYIRTFKSTQKLREISLLPWILMIFTMIFTVFGLCYKDIDVSKSVQYAVLPRRPQREWTAKEKSLEPCSGTSGFWINPSLF